MRITHKLLNLIYATDAWIVGSSIRKEDAKDVDILVPFKNWTQATPFIPDDAKPNSFGGWKFNFEGIDVDIFPGHLEDFMQNAPCLGALHLKSGTKLTKEVSIGKKEFSFEDEVFTVKS